MKASAFWLGGGDCLADVRLDRLLHCLERAVEHDDSVSAPEPGFGEPAADLLEDDSGGGSGVVHEGDLVDVVSVDQVLDYSPRAKNPLPQGVVVEVVGLPEIPELPIPLGGLNGRRAGAEAAIVDPRYALFVVGELSPDLGLQNGQ